MATMEQGAPARIIETLPCRVIIASEEELPRAVALRSEAYSRHLPGLGAALKQIEPADMEPGVEVLVALAKDDGRALATMRVHYNDHKPLPLERSIRLPEAFCGLRLMEATRLGVAKDPLASQARSALFKALFTRCQELRVDRMVVSARDAVDLMYQRLLFVDALEPNKFYPMEHVGGIPHRVMTLDIERAPALYASRSHSMFDMVYGREHPDIELNPAHPVVWAEQLAAA